MVTGEEGDYTPFSDFPSSTVQSGSPKTGCTQVTERFRSRSPRGTTMVWCVPKSSELQDVWSEDRDRGGVPSPEVPGSLSPSTTVTVYTGLGLELCSGDD